MKGPTPPPFRAHREQYGANVASTRPELNNSMGFPVAGLKMARLSPASQTHPGGRSSGTDAMILSSPVTVAVLWQPVQISVDEKVTRYIGRGSRLCRCTGGPVPRQAARVAGFRGWRTRVPPRFQRCSRWSPVRPDPAGLEHGDPDAEGSRLLGQRHREAADRPLRALVRGEPRRTDAAAERGDLDDVGAPARQGRGRAVFVTGPPRRSWSRPAPGSWPGRRRW